MLTPAPPPKPEEVKQIEQKNPGPAEPSGFELSEEEERELAELLDDD